MGVTEDGGKHRSRGTAGAGVLLVQAHHDQILLTVNTDKPRSRTQDTGKLPLSYYGGQNMYFWVFFLHNIH